MTNPDDYRIRNKVCVEGPVFFAVAAENIDAENFLLLIQSLATEAQRTRALQDEVNRLEAELQAAHKNPGEADVLKAEVEALKEQVNTHEMRNSFEQQRSGRLEAELQADRYKRTCTSSEPAYMADDKDVFWTEKGRASDSLPGMHHIIFESEEEAKDGVQILNGLVKQRDQARARVAELEGDKAKEEPAYTANDVPPIIFASEEDAQVLNGLKQRDQARAFVAELEAAAPAAPEDAAEDGGPYSVICEQIVGNQIRSDEGVLTQNPASFAAVGFAPNEAEAFCDRLNLERDRRIKAEYERDVLRTLSDKMKDLEEQARKGLLSTGPAQTLPSGLQVTPVSDGPARDKALIQVSDIKAMLDQIQARCSAADYAASVLQDTIGQGGAK